jgi:putative phosphoesterase
VAAAIEALRQRHVTKVVHCGDIEDAPTVRMFAGLETHFVFGNCDSNHSELREAMRETGATLHEGWGHLELDGIKIGWTHGDDARLLRELENSGHFDYVFHGHTHKAAQRHVGGTLVVNPGALQRARVKTFVVLDLPSGELESVVVE